MLKHEFLDSCYKIFYLNKQTSAEESLKETIKLLQLIHPGLKYSSCRQAYYSQDSKTLTLFVNGFKQDYIQINGERANPAALACLFSGAPQGRNSTIALVEELYYSCQKSSNQREFPTTKTAAILLDWSDKGHYLNLRRETYYLTKSPVPIWERPEGPKIIKLSLEKKLFVRKNNNCFKNTNIVRWIPENISINNLASIVLMTGDLPNKKYAIELSKRDLTPEMNRER